MRIPGELVGHEGDALSEGRLRAATTREIGYSSDTTVTFRYGAEGTVYEAPPGELKGEVLSRGRPRVLHGGEAFGPRPGRRRARHQRLAALSAPDRLRLQRSLNRGYVCVYAQPRSHEASPSAYP